MDHRPHYVAAGVDRAVQRRHAFSVAFHDLEGFDIAASRLHVPHVDLVSLHSDLVCDPLGQKSTPECPGDDLSGPLPLCEPSTHRQKPEAVRSCGVARLHVVWIVNALAK